MKPTIEEAIEGAEVVVIAKRSSEFEDVVRQSNNGRSVVDLVSILPDPTEAKEHKYEGICW
jgi:hypothetical protein